MYAVAHRPDRAIAPLGFRPGVNPPFGAGQGASGPTLAFYAFGDYQGSFQPDVIIGTGNVTEGNTSTRYYPDENGVFQAYGSGEVGQMYYGGEWWAVGQPALTNLCDYATDLTAGGWNGVNGGNAAADRTGLRGDANGGCTVNDPNSGAVSQVRWELTPYSATAYTLVVAIEKDPSATVMPEIKLSESGATCDERLCINPITGEAGQTVGTGNWQVIDAGSCWMAYLQATPDTTGTGFRAALFGAAKAVGDTTANVDSSQTGSTGILYVGLFEEPITSCVGASPIFTSGATGTVNASDMSFDDANHSDTSGVYYCEFTSLHSEASANSGTGSSVLTYDSGSGQLLEYRPDLARLRSADGSNPLVLDGTYAAGVTIKATVVYGDGQLRNGMDGVLGTEGSYDGDWKDGGNGIRVLRSRTNEVGGVSVPYLIRNIRRYDIASYAEGVAYAGVLIA